MASHSGSGEAETIHFPDRESFEAWLEDHAGHQPGVWLKMAKAGTGIPSLTSDEAVDVGLCYGWISGQRRGLEDDYYLQKYVPRRPRSRWSMVNVREVEAPRDPGCTRREGDRQARGPIRLTRSGRGAPRAFHAPIGAG